MTSLTDIKRATADYYRLSVAALEGPARDYRLAHPRQMAMYLGREVARKSWPQIGDAFFRDHTTAYHGWIAVRRRIGTDPRTATACKILSKSLSGAPTLAIRVRAEMAAAEALCLLAVMLRDVWA